MLWFNKKERQKKYLELEKRFRWKYENLRNLLRLNAGLLETLSDIQSFTGNKVPEDAFTHHQISDLVDGAEMMIENLNCLSDNRYHQLYSVYRNIAGDVHFNLSGTKTIKNPPLLLPLNLVGRGLLNYVGGKAGNLGELKNVVPITKMIPDGFVITTAAYHLLLNNNNLFGQLRALYSRIDTNNLREAEIICAEAKRFVENSIIPDVVTEAIDGFFKFNQQLKKRNWAVRSSAVGEDGELSFAGQFDSILNVPPAKLTGAYLKVIASRFNTNAVLFRLMNDVRESETPMSVLFIPMINARASGVVFTADPDTPDGQHALVSAVKGLASNLVSGKTHADTFRVNRDTCEIAESLIVEKESRVTLSDKDGLTEEVLPDALRSAPSLSPEQLKELVETALKIEDHFGKPQDIEWVIDEEDNLKIVQSRPLRFQKKDFEVAGVETGSKLLAEGGSTIYPGIAQGRMQCIHSLSELDEVKDGVILVSRSAEPEIVSVFPRISGLISEVGHPTGHAATLARESRLPTLFNIPGVIEKLKDTDEIGLDSTRKKIYAGLPWPDLPEREIKKADGKSSKPNPLDSLIFNLNLTDPGETNFTARGCKSLHDIIRFVHEKAVSSMFDIGDRQVENLKHSIKTLDSHIPLFLTVLDIGGALDEKYDKQKKIPPEGIRSIPFRSLWRGIEDPEISWTGRKNVSLSGLATVVMSSAAGHEHDGRQMGDRNYLIVGPEYLNLNARLAYHYSMIDAMVCDRAVNNYIAFRFRGGGASRSRRSMRAKFLAGVLLYSGFSVDRVEDLVTARYRGYDRKVCEEKLEMLGKLTGCARQLDMLLDSNETVKRYIDRFLNGDYGFFH
ncbi:MAG: hypothetical protein GF307_06705 [candidate division Zixibacteria bacterium]|nr:hypothetical protein [candidate division Zixibacteria bacterium]